MLLSTGLVHGDEYWEPTELSAVTRGHIEDCARGYLLCVLAPATIAGRREIVKLSFHSQIAPSCQGLTGSLDRLRVGARSVGKTIELQMVAPSDTRSYHLEFRTPPELECIELRIPDSRSETTQDISGQPVAHVHAFFDSPPLAPAVVTLMVPRAGMWRYATLASGVIAAIAWLEITLPNAQQALLQAADGAAAFLLALPAVVIGFLSAGRESALTAWALGPLRAIMLLCSVGLLAVAGGIVGKLSEPWTTALCWTLAVSATSFVALLIWPHRVTEPNPKNVGDVAWHELCRT